jgi:hypothetical protein
MESPRPAIDVEAAARDVVLAGDPALALQALLVQVWTEGHLAPWGAPNPYSPPGRSLAPESLEPDSMFQDFFGRMRK